MSEIETLRAALTQIVDSYDNTGCDGCGVVSHDAYVAAEAALRQQTPIESSETSNATRTLTEIQMVDPYEISSIDSHKPINDPIDW